MTRFEYSENMRRIRAEEARSPIDAAYFALCALSDADLNAALDRYSATFQNATPPRRIALSIAEAAQ